MIPPSPGLPGPCLSLSPDKGDLGSFVSEPEPFRSLPSIIPFPKSAVFLSDPLLLRVVDDIAGICCDDNDDGEVGDIRPRPLRNLSGEEPSSAVEGKDIDALAFWEPRPPPPLLLPLPSGLVSTLLLALPVLLLEKEDSLDSTFPANVLVR